MAKLWINGEEVGASALWSIHESAKTNLTPIEGEYLAFNVPEFSATMRYVNSPENKAWVGSLSGQTQMRVYPSGNRWFMPWFEMSGYVQSAWAENLGFSIDHDTVEKRWKNRLAPIVYWLWLHVWCPIRQIRLRKG